MLTLRQELAEALYSEVCLPTNDKSAVEFKLREIYERAKLHQKLKAEAEKGAIESEYRIAKHCLDTLFSSEPDMVDWFEVNHRIFDNVQIGKGDNNA